MSHDDLIHDGECPVCGDEFADGFDEFNEGDTIEGVRICVIEKDSVSEVGDAIIHLPD